MENETGRPPAVLTGAWSGLGYEPARQFAAVQAEMHRKMSEPGSADK